MNPTATSPARGTVSDARGDTVEARLAARLAAALNMANESLPRDTAERLRFARERALARAAEVRRAARHTARAGIVQASHTGALTFGQMPAWWQSLAVLLPLVVMVVGLVFIDLRVEEEQVQAMADIDTMLLTDRLPPEAYSDPGFAEYLRSAPTP